MICVGCKFANWSRTKTGALHPNGSGKCTWKATMKVPGSFNDYLYFRKLADRQLEFAGGYIDRRAKHPVNCDVKEQQ